MGTLRTIECEIEECGYTTDVELTDENAPRHCPKCGFTLYIAGTEISWPTDDSALSQ